MDWSIWGPGIGVLVGAGLFAAFLARGSGRDGRMGGVAASDDLAQKKANLYRLLADLHASRLSLPEADFLAERDRLELAAAEVLQAMADAPAAEVSPVSAEEVVPSVPLDAAALQKAAYRRGALVGAGIVGLLLLLGALLSRFTFERPEGGSLTGNSMVESSPPTPTPAAARPQIPEAQLDPQLSSLMQRASAAPEDLDLQNELGHALLTAERYYEVFQVSQRVLERDPGNADALIHMGVVRLIMRDLPSARDLLSRGLAASPESLEGLTWSAALDFEEGYYDDAVAAWERVIEQDPTSASSLQPLVTRAQALAAGETPPPLPPAPSVNASQARPSAPSAGADPLDLAGTISVAGGTSPSRTSTLFLMARAAGVTGGPPAAVQRLTVSPGSFPLSFELGPRHAMMGGPFPDTLDVSARIDADGDPLTRGPDDLVGGVAGVAAGTRGLVLQLSRAEP